MTILSIVVFIAILVPCAWYAGVRNYAVAGAGSFLSLLVPTVFIGLSPHATTEDIAILLLICVSAPIVLGVVFWQTRKRARPRVS